MTKLVKCKVRKGHQYSYVDHSDGEPKRVTAVPGDIVHVSEVAATRFTHVLLDVNQATKEAKREIDLAKANKELEGKSSEKIEEEAEADAKKADKAANTKSSK